MTVTDKLEALANGPKPWLVTMTYESGKVRTLRQPRGDMARSFADRLASLIGKTLVSRATGDTSTLRAVVVTYQPESM